MVPLNSSSTEQSRKSYKVAYLSFLFENTDYGSTFPVINIAKLCNLKQEIKLSVTIENLVEKYWLIQKKQKAKPKITQSVVYVCMCVYICSLIRTIIE